MAKDAKKPVTVDQLSAVATKVKTWGKNNFVENVTLSSGKIQKTINGTTTDVATIPTSLPNPNSLKLQAGGVDKVTYDGNSSATLNIAPGSSNGTISVGGTDVSVTGLGSLAYVNSLSASDVNALPSTTKYAGSSTAGGAATSAAKLTNTSKIGDTNKPVYFTANGVPAAVTHTLDADVPSNAVFTDTTYESKSAASGGTAVSLVTTGEKYAWNNKQDALSFNQTPSSSNKVATMADIPSVPVSSVAGKTGAVTLAKGDVGLDNVGNFKAVSTEASQGLSSTEQSNARANIGAGTSNFSGSYNDLSNKPNSLPASDVYDWAKAASKPSYSYSEISNTPSSLPANGGNADTVDGYHAASFCMSNDSRLSDSRTPYFANNTWYAVGDDSAIGDHNASGTFCIKGLNGTPGINLYDNSDALYASVIHSANIGSQSVNYATSAGSASTVNGHSVNSDVPSNAVFTDTNTTYGLSINGSTNGDSNGTSLGTIYAPTTAGTSGYVLTSSGSGAPIWAAASGGGNIDYTTTTSDIQNIDATIISTALRKTAQTLTAAEKTQVKTNLGITISTTAPTSSDGEDGDIWLVYDA